MNSLHSCLRKTLWIASILFIAGVSAISQIQADQSDNSFVGISPPDVVSDIDRPSHSGSSQSAMLLHNTAQHVSEKPVTLSNSITQGNVFIQDSLNIGLESGATGYRLSVDGKIMCEELKVQSSATWPDYVFGEHYPLMPLNELEKHIAQHQHLPGIPSANEIKDEGVMVGEMQRLMMEKIEELTLYIIEQDEVRGWKQGRTVESLPAGFAGQKSRIKN
jgi:hypothetical protein